MATRAKKSAARKSAARKPAATKPAAQESSSSGRLAMSVPPQSPPPKPKPKPKPQSNFCEDHGRLLRADRTCPVSTCRFNTKPMP